MRTILVFALVVISLTSADAGPLERQGRAIAQKLCAPCHAIGARGKSPVAGAPEFRHLERTVDLDTFGDRLQDGLFSGHKDMPRFNFKRAEAEAFVAYLHSIAAE